jgi:hypothetical protein
MAHSLLLGIFQGKSLIRGAAPISPLAIHLSSKLQGILAFSIIQDKSLCMI